LSLGKILVIQTAYLGDLIWTTPLMKTLASSTDEQCVDVLCLPSTREVIDGLPFIGDIITHDKWNFCRGILEILEIVRTVKNKGYDIVVSPHLSFRSTLFSFSSGAKLRVGFERAVFSYLYNLRVPFDNDVHYVDRYLELARALGIEKTDRTMSASIDDESMDRSETLLQGKDDFIAIFIGSQWQTKRYSPQYFKELIKLINDRTGYPIVILGTEADRMPGEEILSGNVKGLNLCGKTSLNVLTSILIRAKACIGGDTGGIHIAEALYIPTIILYGSTSPDSGIGPIQGNYTVLRSKLGCSPCSTHGLKRCPEGLPYCMTDITPEMVFSALIKILG